MDGDASLGDPGPVFGDAEGVLDPGATQRGSRGRTLGMTPPGGGKEPGGVPRGFPGGTEQREGLGGEGDGPVFGPLAPLDLALEARALKVGDLQAAGWRVAEGHAGY